MKHLKENRNTFPNWMYCKKAEIDLSKSGTGLFPGDFYMNRHVKRVILPDYTDTVPANMFYMCDSKDKIHLDYDLISFSKIINRQAALSVSKNKIGFLIIIFISLYLLIL